MRGVILSLPSEQRNDCRPADHCKSAKRGQRFWRLFFLKPEDRQDKDRRQRPQDGSQAGVEIIEGVKQQRCRNDVANDVRKDRLSKKRNGQLALGFEGPGGPQRDHGYDKGGTKKPDRGNGEGGSCLPP